MPYCCSSAVSTTSQTSAGRPCDVVKRTSEFRQFGMVEHVPTSEFWRAWQAIRSAEYHIPGSLVIIALTPRSCVCLMTELAKIDSRLSVYFTAVAFLHVAARSLRHGLSNELMDILATLLLDQFICGRRYSSNCTSSLLLDTAAKLMQVVANKSLSTVQLIEIELSKAYLYSRPRPSFAQDDDEVFVTGSTLHAGDGGQSPHPRTQPPLVITPFSAAV